jgi:FSR family fosmidomycin resistance protein-like MFS transporter
MTVLLALLFSKYFYLASITSYFTFYLIDHSTCVEKRAAASVRVPGAVAAGASWAGRSVIDCSKYGIKGSIPGVLPFTLLLPHANLF